ncbi:RNA exonuclease 3 [Exophiala dermatitidis]|uniref:RNA exonuclease Rex3 n=1 Tax=Exophiala dermatitidis (strain ATCC 34100 / CBS 525.76 / NIH/UT8656) TaxID=858893 RepID=H6CB63_EXODN|nr:RNA exonuclease Rex3 [Exophiala dermatitidis NIH/UT8656]EHY61010.1 RNA exonuclease Rex3 [Exophiala dermatitidis NIH/UT8656]
MFSALGLFKGVQCPQHYDCTLTSCFFSHGPVKTPDDAAGTIKAAQEYNPFSAGEITTPPAKRRRLASPRPQDVEVETGQIHSTSSKPQLTPVAKKDVTPLLVKDGNTPAPARVSKAQASEKKAIPTSVTRTVSPPPTKEPKAPAASTGRKVLKAESLTPRNVAKAPALWKTRLAVLQKLHEQLRAQNQKLESSGNGRKALVLSGQELITFALDEEEEAASKLTDNIYKNAMAQKILRIKKMTTDEWVKAVADWMGYPSQTQPQEKVNKSATNMFPPGLSSTKEQIAVLRHLRTPLEGLEKFGYVTSKPSASEIASVKAALAATGGFETCDRCSTRFQVFPGRDENGRLTSKGKCRYHWARSSRSTSFKTDRMYGQSETLYPCCNKAPGSEGCSEAETHVFSVKDPKRLAAVLQFEHTPDKPDIRGNPPISFDCEMGYTTLGLEVIRVTAVSWPEGKLLVDVLVRPYGEVLDLNTRFSGVTQQAFADALPYEAAMPDQDDLGAHDNPDQVVQLRKVESPAAARQLLFDRLTPDTPLIGHAIENDLNVCRIIHPFVIDTALLYPHPRGLPIRYGLKMLSQKHLSRGIQTGGEAGHDSKEDAVATGDLVTKKVAEKWRMMQHEGWEFVDGLLTAPEETKRVENVRGRPFSDQS